MVIIDVPAPVAAVFSFGQELGEPDWRCIKTCDGLLLSIRWNSRISTTTENVATHNRQRKIPNSRQRRSRRRMESFLARKRATVDQEAADGLSCRTPDRERPRKQLQDSTQATCCFHKIRSQQAFTFWTWKSRHFCGTCTGLDRRKKMATKTTRETTPCGGTVLTPEVYTRQP